MAAPPPPKRRRLNPDETSDPLARVTPASIRRADGDVRQSLQHLHDQLERYGDVVVKAQGSVETREFVCVAALLAAASRPLSAMLYGQMRAVVPGCGERPELSLRLTEPRHFELLLRYVHGHDIRALLPPPTPRARKGEGGGGRGRGGRRGRGGQTERLLCAKGAAR